MDLSTVFCVTDVWYSGFDFSIDVLSDDVLCSGKVVSPVHGLTETVVGVLGGGQLGRMLCQAASNLGIKVMVLDPMENCPASALSHYHMVGSFDDSSTVKEFAKRFNSYAL